MQYITVLGATGSIGLSTLDVVARHPDKYAIFALTANSRVDELAALCIKHQPKYAVVADAVRCACLDAQLKAAGCVTQPLYGVQALCDVAADASVDVVMAAIVGAAGLLPTLAAVNAGKKVLLANKEALVMAGRLFMDAVANCGATLLPIDSEHNAIFQCLPVKYASADQAGVSKLLLSASGGPFRTWSASEISSATPEQACAHPNWSMGRKISVDSATLMNKGLEVIEACHLFNVSADRVEVVVHPQSIIHSLVQYVDGSVLAQLGNPDMRTPIAHALAWPQRIDAGVAPLDLFAVAQLNFEKPDIVRFSALDLAFQASRSGGSAPAVLNAANEIAVQAFLDERIGFGQISQLVAEVLNHFPVSEPDCLEAVQECDFKARQKAVALVKEWDG